jgi:hypothetical protein
VTVKRGRVILVDQFDIDAALRRSRQRAAHHESECGAER